MLCLKVKQCRSNAMNDIYSRSSCCTDTPVEVEQGALALTYVYLYRQRIWLFSNLCIEQEEGSSCACARDRNFVVLLGGLWNGTERAGPGTYRREKILGLHRTLWWVGILQKDRKVREKGREKQRKEKPYQRSFPVSNLVTMTASVFLLVFFRFLHTLFHFSIKEKVNLNVSMVRQCLLEQGARRRGRNNLQLLNPTLSRRILQTQ